MTANARNEDLFAEAAGRVAEIAGVATSLVRNVAGHVEALVEDVVDDSLDVAREAEDLYDSARTRIDDAAELFRAAPRITRVASEFLSILARYRVHGALDAARSEWTGEPRSDLSRLHRRSARRARRMAEELRGGVLKLGQFASTRMDLLPTEWTRELSKLQDRVKPLPASEITARLARELGEDWRGQFRDFEAAPIAAASLAQVHRATLADGTPVAVKVLVPDIEATLEADLVAMRTLLPTLRDLLPRVDLDTLIEELAASIRREVDLGAEAAAVAEMREAFRDDPDVIVPAPHPEASSRGVLVLDLVEGERLVDFLDGCAARGEAGARDRDRVCQILIRTLCSQVLVHGLFQGDPHPGNFLVAPGPEGPRLVLLDFGCVERYEPALRRSYAQLAMAILARNTEGMVAGFAGLGFRSRDGGTEGLDAYAELFLSAFRDGTNLEEEMDHGEQIARILELTEANPIAEIPGHFVLLGRMFASVGGLLLHYRPRIELAGILRPELASALRPI